MKRLLSLPPNLVNHFYDITQHDRKEWFCTSDPVNKKLGSGGGSIWILDECRKSEGTAGTMPFSQWTAQDRRILLHAGGQSRRLPAYAPEGKILTPIPVFRWKRGQQLDQTLLTLQLPLYENIIQKAPRNIHTLIASGDVYIRATEQLQTIPDADVICYGVWADPQQARNHGVFLMNRNAPEVLDYMLQKPSTETLSKLMHTHFFLMDIGVWLLSDKAVERLRNKVVTDNGYNYYDLYADFGCALGMNPSKPDNVLNDLKTVILPMPGGEFYHFGTTHELLSSTTAIQNLVKDQRFIIQKDIKKHPSVFVQNTQTHCTKQDTIKNVWIENSYVPSTWNITANHVLTGIPENDWHISLHPGNCIDMVPIGENQFALRPYGFYDTFSGNIEDETTLFMGIPIKEWLKNHHIQPEDLENTSDIQCSKLFPITDRPDRMQQMLVWMLAPSPQEDLYRLWKAHQRMSANDLLEKANLLRREEQRKKLRIQALPLMAANYTKSVFYQTNLQQTAATYAAHDLPLPDKLPNETSPLLRMHDAMFRTEVLRLQGKEYQHEEARAYALMRETLTESARKKDIVPHLNTYKDQIVWGRSSVRIDVAGGWTDTPPYSLAAGGNVVNLAIELNGQPPLQVYIKPSQEWKIVCRSIDLGAMECIESYEQLQTYNRVGSPFSIPKAALALIGFAPDFSPYRYNSLQDQLRAFGCGIEITLLSAMPAGSGLGTSSILASTVIGALSDFCGLGLDKNDIGYRTLILEQMLTTGGGWQDQYGGILHGVKLLQTTPGLSQNPVIRWLPETIFKHDEYRTCHLLYYTGVTRTAKSILTDIVRGMFLNNTKHLTLLKEMKCHAIEMHDAIQKSNFTRYGELVRLSWEQNKRLDAGTNPPVIEALCRKIDDWCLGYKLPGAGGGGYMYMVAKDPQAALLIRNTLLTEPICDSARFVDMTISDNGLQVSRS